VRVLIFGDRDWTHIESIRTVLEFLRRRFPDIRIIIVHGAARGADYIAGKLAEEIFGPENVEAHPADWAMWGKRAGSIRNADMLLISADRALNDGCNLRMAIGFHADIEHSKGSKDMKGRLDKAGIPCKVISQ
jgi:hypothetical protein